MSRLFDGNVGTSSMQSWRTQRDTTESEKCPTSNWFRKYHTNSKTEQWRFREGKKDNRDLIWQNKPLEQASSCDVWKAIRRSEAETSTNALNMNSMMTIHRQRIVKNPNNGTRANRITSSYDVLHRMHELKCPYGRDERNWRLKIEKTVEKKCTS